MGTYLHQVSLYNQYAKFSKAFSWHLSPQSFSVNPICQVFKVFNMGTYHHQVSLYDQYAKFSKAFSWHLSPPSFSEQPLCQVFKSVQLAPLCKFLKSFNWHLIITNKFLCNPVMPPRYTHNTKYLKTFNWHLLPPGFSVPPLYQVIF